MISTSAVRLPLSALPLKHEELALVLALTLGALLSPALLFPALGFAGVFAVGSSMRADTIPQRALRGLVFGGISLMTGIAVGLALGCPVGFLAMIGVYAISSTKM